MVPLAIEVRVLHHADLEIDRKRTVKHWHIEAIEPDKGFVAIIAVIMPFVYGKRKNPLL